MSSNIAALAAAAAADTDLADDADVTPPQKEGQGGNTVDKPALPENKSPDLTAAERAALRGGAADSGYTGGVIPYKKSGPKPKENAKNRRVSLKIRTDLYDAIKAKADSEDRSVNYAIEDILYSALNMQKPPKEDG